MRANGSSRADRGRGRTLTCGARAGSVRTRRSLRRRRRGYARNLSLRITASLSAGTRARSTSAVPAITHRSHNTTSPSLPDYRDGDLPSTHAADDAPSLCSAGNPDRCGKRIESADRGRGDLRSARRILFERVNHFDAGDAAMREPELQIEPRRRRPEHEHVALRPPTPSPTGRPYTAPSPPDYRVGAPLSIPRRRNALSVHAQDSRRMRADNRELADRGRGWLL